MSATWDKEVPTSDWWREEIAAFRAARYDPDSPHTIMIVYESHMFAAFKVVLDELGYANGQVFFIYNKDKNQKGVNQFIPAVTMVWVTHFPKTQGNPPIVTMNLDKNPLLRHNIAGSNGVRADRVRLADGSVANPTQKPVNVFAALFRTCANPGTSIYIPCGGSASLVLAAIMAKCDVVGIECDKKQFDAATSRLLTATSECEELLGTECNISLCQECFRDADSMVGSGPASNQSGIQRFLRVGGADGADGADGDDDDAKTPAKKKRADKSNKRKKPLNALTACELTKKPSKSSSCACRYCKGGARSASASPPSSSLLSSAPMPVAEPPLKKLKSSAPGV